MIMYSGRDSRSRRPLVAYSLGRRQSKSSPVESEDGDAQSAPAKGKGKDKTNGDGHGHGKKAEGQKGEEAGGDEAASDTIPSPALAQASIPSTAGPEDSSEDSSSTTTVGVATTAADSVTSNSNIPPTTTIGDNVNYGVQTPTQSNIATAVTLNGSIIIISSIAGPTITPSSNPSSSEGNSNASPTTTGSNLTTHHGISKNAIIAIATVLSLVFLGFFLFLLRRCSIARRAESRQRFWFRYSKGGNCGAMPTGNRDSGYRSWTLSTRSSFVASSQGSTPRSSANFEGLMPAMAPMAEVRGGPGSPLMRDGGGPNLPGEPPAPPWPFRSSFDSSNNNSTNPNRRNSTSSTRSISPTHFQYLFVRPEQPNRIPNTDGLPVPTSNPTRPMFQNSKEKSPASPTDALSDNINSLVPTVPQVPPGSSIQLTNPSSSQVESESLRTVRHSSGPRPDDQMAAPELMTMNVVQTFNNGWALVEKVTMSIEKSLGVMPINRLREAGLDPPRNEGE